MSEMQKTVYLHIGANKTGSSAIQNFCNSNRSSLLSAGLLYPVTGCVGDAHYGISSVLGFAHGSKNPTDRTSKAMTLLRTALRTEVERSGVRDVVISSEFFVLPKSVESVMSFFDGYLVKVVIYVRRHDKWWPSAYNQAVRTVVTPPWGRGFQSYMKFFMQKQPCPSRAAFRMLVDRWAAVFGKDNLIVRPYESQQNMPGIAADFFGAIGHERVVDGLLIRENRVNDSVDYTTLAYVDMIQRARLDEDLRAALIEFVTSRKSDSKEAMSVDPALLCKLVRQNQDDYEYIAKEYLGREDGRLFYDELPDPGMPWLKPKQPKPSEVIEMMADFFQERQQLIRSMPMMMSGI